MTCECDFRSCFNYRFFFFSYALRAGDPLWGLYVKREGSAASDALCEKTGCAGDELRHCHCADEGDSYKECGSRCGYASVKGMGGVVLECFVLERETMLAERLD